MNKIHRVSPPDCLNDQIPKSKNKKIRFYKDLWDNNRKIKPRWNTTCKEGGLVSKIRQTLLEMSNKTCVYCGVKIDNSNMDVDHYLPSSEFPYLAYCWDNLLPTCKRCNQKIKSDFCPKSLTGKEIVEPILSVFLLPTKRCHKFVGWATSFCCPPNVFLLPTKICHTISS